MTGRSEAIRRLVELGLKVKKWALRGSPWTPEKDGLLRSTGAAGESAAAIATLLKRTPRRSTQASSLAQDQVSPFTARAEGEGEMTTGRFVSLSPANKRSLLAGASR
jgi:hypothetical protein